jgi:ribosomal protein L29
MDSEHVTIGEMWQAAGLLQLQGYIVTVILLGIATAFTLFYATAKLYDEEGELYARKIINAFVFGAIAPWVAALIFGVFMYMAFQEQNLPGLIFLAVLCIPVTIIAPIVVYMHNLDWSLNRGVLMLLVPQGLMMSFGIFLIVFVPWVLMVPREQKLALKEFVENVTGEDPSLAHLAAETPAERFKRMIYHKEIKHMALEGQFHEMNADEVNLVERYLETELHYLRQYQAYAGLMTPEELKDYKQRLADVREINRRYREAYASSSE